jgi:hypothetical protein
VCKPSAVKKSFFLTKFLEFVHDIHDMEEDLKSLKPYVYVSRIIHRGEKVFLLTFIEIIINYGHLTLKVDWKSWCPAHFLCQRSDSPNDIRFVWHVSLNSFW